MSTPESAPPSAAAPSPFPPIADYAFLSNCHTGALVAPDGAIDWLCVPRFDSPSIFGTLLDRGAGVFRLGPFGFNVPTARFYEPGTNTVSTTWNTPTGWILVRDALTMGPSRGEDRDHTPYAAPGRRRRRPPARAHRPLPRGRRGDRAGLRAGLRLRARPRRVVDGGQRPPHGRRHRGGPDRPAANGHGDRHRGRPRAGSPRREAGRPGLLLALLVRGAGLAAGHRRGQRADGGHTALLARLARARPQCRPPLAPAHPALGPGDQGSHLHADRRHRGRPHHLAARDARR